MEEQYDKDLLLEFAELCKACGLTPNDLVELKNDIYKCYRLVRTQMDESYVKSVVTALKILR